MKEKEPHPKTPAGKAPEDVDDFVFWGESDIGMVSDR